ncbi:MAG: LURP-one-related family protein [Oscillospiraceae bacterium]|nr:LURP-one-related family protein [Oscillospiraceae bacterium]
MRLLFKQRLFSWFDSYDVYNEAGETVYTVQGKLAWGHKLVVSDASGRELATVREKFFHFLPQFEVWLGNQLVGTVKREFTFFRPRYQIDFRGWEVEGNMLEWDYTVCDAQRRTVATVSKEPFHWADTYVLDIVDPRDALCVLTFVLAIDAEKCSRS